MSRNTPHTSPPGSVTFYFLVFNFIENQVSLKCEPSMRPLESEACIWRCADFAFNHDYLARPKNPLMGAEAFQIAIYSIKFLPFQKEQQELWPGSKSPVSESTAALCHLVHWQEKVASLRSLHLVKINNWHFKKVQTVKLDIQWTIFFKVNLKEMLITDASTDTFKPVE